MMLRLSAAVASSKVQRRWFAGLLFFTLILLLCAAISSPARYAAAVRANPILAMPAVDTDHYDYVLTALDEQHRAIAAYYPTDEATALTRSLAPERFLRAAGELEHRRRTLLEQPTLNHTFSYAYQLFKTLHALRRDAHLFAKDLTAHPLEKDIAFIDGITSTETLKEAAHAIERTAHQRSFGALTQLSCLLIPTTACAIAPSTGKPPPTTRRASAYDYAARERLSGIHQELSDHRHTDEQIIVGTSRCALSSETIFSVWHREGALGAVREHAFLPDILVIPYASIPAEPQPNAAKDMRARAVSPVLHRWFIERDVRYLYQPAGGLYYCIESGFDVGVIGRIHALQQTARNAAPELAGTLQQAELSESVAYEALQEALSRPDLSTTTKNNLAVAWRSGTANFDEVLAATHAHNVYILASLQKGDMVPASTLLVMRSYPSVYFQAFNETLYDAPLVFVKERKRFSTKQFKIRTFEAAAAEIGTSTLQSALKYGFSVMDGLLQETLVTSTQKKEVLPATNR